MNKIKILTDALKDGLKEHEVMRNHTTMRVGGVADFYFEAKTVDDLVKAVKVAIKTDTPYFIIGGGSNIIFSDFGYPGLVIKNSTSNIAFMNEKSQAIVDAGVPLISFILSATSHNLSGLEFLYGVPGTVGGSIYGNAGAYGQAIGDFVKYVTVLMPSGEIVQQEAKWMEFGYRESILKKETGSRKPVILSCRIQLAQNRQGEIMRRINSYKEKRWQTQPVGMSAGCIFRNPIPKELENVTGRGSKGMPDLPKERRAGYILDKSGAKKLKVGNAKVSSKHANFIINESAAKAQEIRQLIELMRSAVKEKFDVDLREEVEFVGQW